MANEITYVNGITKQEINGSFTYHFALAEVIADNVGNYVAYRFNFIPDKLVIFDEIPDKKGATTPEEFVDILANENAFSTTTSSSVSNQIENRVVCRSPEDLQDIDSSKQYLIDGVIDFTGTGLNIEIPASGASITGLSFELSSLICSDDNYTLFTSPLGGSGNLIMKNLAITTSGTGSKVYDLTGLTGNEAIEVVRINYNNCSSLGVQSNYRQGLEEGTGRFGGTPELTIEGASWSGYRISISIARNMSNFTALFKAGAGLEFSSRFATDINCDLPSTGALFDFAPTNFAANERLQIQNSTITRQGVLDSSDTTIYPNIDDTAIQSKWKGNSGLPNTQKYIKASVTTEVTTPIAAVSTFVPLEGIFTTSLDSHLDSPVNGEFRLLSGNGKYNIKGNLEIDGNANVVLQIRATKSTDDGVTFSTVIDTITRTISNLQGGNDVAFVPIDFLTDLKENDRVRLEVANTTNNSNFTAKLDSIIIITEI